MAAAGVSLRVPGVPRAFVSEEHAVLRGANGYLFAPAAFNAWIQELQTKTWILHAEPVNLGHEREQTHAEAAEQTLGTSRSMPMA
jgi:hypothetical protein